MAGFIRTLTQRVLQTTVSRFHGPASIRRPPLPTCTVLLTREYSTPTGSTPDSDLEQDTPIKYSTSKAHGHKSYETFLTEEDAKTPFYQPFVVLISTATFLIYFLYLREENDMDEELDKTLYDKIPGLQEKTSQALSINAPDIEGNKTAAVRKPLKN